MNRDIFKDTVVIEEETGIYVIIERINDSNEAYGSFDRETSIEGWKRIKKIDIRKSLRITNIIYDYTLINLFIRILIEIKL